MEKIEKVLPYIDLFMPSFDECRYMTGSEDIREMIRIYREKGSRDMVIKWDKVKTVGDDVILVDLESF